MAGQFAPDAARLYLGFLGERAVGEELNKLMFDRYHVFHDFPGGDDWNIDHVIVGPSGVFAVETKAYRKRKGAGPDFHKVVFDGKTLRFPCRGGKSRVDTKPLDQARRNSKSLSVFLSKSTGEPTHVEPILTFPGWFVDRKGLGDVHVLNHRQFRDCVVRNGPAKLSSEQIQRIVHQLEQQCRNVEF